MAAVGARSLLPIIHSARKSARGIERLIPALRGTKHSERDGAPGRESTHASHASVLIWASMSGSGGQEAPHVRVDATGTPGVVSVFVRTASTSTGSLTVTLSGDRWYLSARGAHGAATVTVRCVQLT